MAKRIDPYRSFNFRVQFEEMDEAGFQECSGLDVTVANIDYREGSDENHVRKLCGLTTYSPIVLKRGIVDSTDFWEWLHLAVAGSPVRRNGSIVLLNEKHEEKLRWNFRNAYPYKWSGPALNSTSNAVAIESLEIVHEQLVRDKQPAGG